MVSCEGVSHHGVDHLGFRRDGAHFHHMKTVYHPRVKKPMFGLLIVSMLWFISSFWWAEPIARILVPVLVMKPFDISNSIIIGDALLIAILNMVAGYKWRAWISDEMFNVQVNYPRLDQDDLSYIRDNNLDCTIHRLGDGHKIFHAEFHDPESAILFKMARQ